jgi:peptidoglycan/LPS O-acetylase OafA/YrhL
VYLVHKPVFMALRPELVKHGIDPGAPLTIVTVMAAGVFGGWVLYRLVETPFMRLRARWYPAAPSVSPVPPVCAREIAGASQ